MSPWHWSRQLPVDGVHCIGDAVCSNLQGLSRLLLAVDTWQTSEGRFWATTCLEKPLVGEDAGRKNQKLKTHWNGQHRSTTC